MENKASKYFSIFLILLALAMSLPELSKTVLYDVIVQIRQSIHSGDSSFLLLASMTSCFLFSVPSILMYLSIECLLVSMELRTELPPALHNAIVVFVFLICSAIPNYLFHQSTEIATSLIALFITLLLVYLTKYPSKAILPKIFIGVQVFFFMQWLNVMPFFSNIQTGIGDIPVSIKIASNYLENTYVLNSLGFSFIIPMLLSSGMTALIFRMYMNNLAIVEENYQREIALETMQNKIMDNRIYQEINALAHDLKTPLATIRGLSSLLALAKDVSKIETYSNRIDQAVVKMSDMISSFLYGSARQWIDVSVLLSYIRAQIPVEDEHIHFFVHMEENLPPLYINKIRIARAIVNLIENAILAPNTLQEKRIDLQIEKTDHMLIIKIKDNGKGILPADLEKIWQIGYSSKNTTGLGLPFAKQTIDEHGGNIGLTSQYGIGTTVTVELPLIEKGDNSCPIETQ